MSRIDRRSSVAVGAMGIIGAMSKINLRDKPICITGASSGIGRATAIECARSGMPVVCAARREDKLREVVEEIRTQGGRAEYVVVDVADAGACRAMIDSTVETFGSIYAVFANAGYGVERAVHEMSDADLREMFEVNFFGTMNSIRPAIGPMIEQGAGHVLLCSSCLAKFSMPYYGVYGATKAAQCHIGRAMKLELESTGVHVSTILPVGTRTEFGQVSKRRSGVSPIMDRTPDRFMQSAERVARAIVKCLGKPKSEVWTSRLTLYSAAVMTAFPRSVDVIGRSMVKRRQRETASSKTS